MDYLVSIASSPWVLLALFVLVLLDSFLVVLPGEIAVVVMGSLAISSGQPNLILLIMIAALAASAGDNLSYAVGRFIGSRERKLFRKPQFQTALASAERLLKKRAALLIFTARYIPFARIAVNLTAGSIRFNYRRYLPLTLFAGLSWALYNSLIGALLSYWLSEHPIWAIVLSVVTAVIIGMLVDWISQFLHKRADDRAAAEERRSDPETEVDPLSH